MHDVNSITNGWAIHLQLLLFQLKEHLFFIFFFCILPQNENIFFLLLFCSCRISSVFMRTIVGFEQFFIRVAQNKKTRFFFSISWFRLFCWRIKESLTLELHNRWMSLLLLFVCYLLSMFQSVDGMGENIVETHA